MAKNGKNSNLKITKKQNISNNDIDLDLEETENERTNFGENKSLSNDGQESINDLKVEEEAIREHTDALKYEVPINLLDAAEKITQKVKNLPKDEFGDYVYDETNAGKFSIWWLSKNIDDFEAQSLKKAGEIMQFWVDKMFNTK
jgi:hypothetical protein